ncbi:MAG: DUF6745 domain-containing protein [Planctomycetota bacterium]|jgi:hypothetical protein
MTDKIEKLTPEQEKLLPVYRDKWIEIGLSCEPLMVAEAKIAAAQAYKAANLPVPDVWHICDSPQHAARVAAVLKSLDFMIYSDDPEQQAKWKALKPDEMSVDEYRSLLAEHNVTAKDRVSDMIYGSHDADWLSFYDYMDEVLALECVKPLRGLIELAKCCGWWAPYEKAVILQHRHTELHRDEEGRLHNESGPAVRYRDGWSVWAIHGVMVNEQIVMRPETLTVEQIKKGEVVEPPDQWGGAELRFDGAEVKRIMRERFGTGRYLKETNAKLIDTDQVAVNVLDPTTDYIPRALLEEHNGDRYLVGTDGSTKRAYFMRVPNNVNTCEEAHNALMGGDEKKILASS